VSELPSSPYKGLNAFDDSTLDALFFFGREREREIVVANLIASRLTVLYGPSGVGKSSLLRAAVARSLRDLPERPLVVVFSRWSDDPALGLAAAVEEGAEGERRPPLLEVLAHAQSERDIYLILDQAEEYFLYHADDAGAGSFAAALPAVLAAPLRVNVLVSLREDSLAKLDRFTGHIPGLFANTLRLDRLDRAAAQMAIVRPVERFAELTGESVSIGPDLVDRVLDEVGAGQIESALGGLGGVEGDAASVRIEAPYLQLVMQRLWEEERAGESSELRAETLERLGGAQHIVEEHLEGALDELAPEQRDVAARLFNHLVTPSGTKIAHEVSDLADFGDVPAEDVQPVLEALSERRILRSLEEGGTVRYEIFHDVLAHPMLAWRARHRAEREVEWQLAERHRRRTRAQRLLGLGLAALAAVVAVVVFALVQRSNANEQAREAQARRLDAAAVALLPEDPELSLLLAAESARQAPAEPAEDALLQSLLASRIRDSFASEGPISDLAYSPDGRYLAYASDDGRVRVRDARTGEELFARRVGEGGGVAFSPDGELVLIHGAAGPAQVLDMPSGAPRCVLDEGGRAPADATLASGRAFVVRDGRAQVFDSETCRRVATIDDVGTTAVRVVASPSGNRVAFLSGRRAQVADVPSGRVLFSLEHPGEITSLAFNANGRRIVTGGRDRLARIWNGFTGNLIHELSGHQGQVLDVAIGPGGTEVATASTDGTARIWDGVSGLLRGSLFGHTNFVGSVAFSPDGQSVVTSSRDGTARTWALNGRLLAILAGHSDPVDVARFAPNGFSVATGGGDGTVRIWDAGTRQDLVKADVRVPEPPDRTATSPDGQATATADGAVVRLERADGTTEELVRHRLDVSSVAFSPDSRRLVTAGRDHDAILWDVASGRALRSLRGHFGSVSDARFSPDGRWIVTAGPRSIGLWRASDGHLIRLLVGPEGPFTAATFLDDSRTIVAVSEGGVVSAFECGICGRIPELLELADERLTATGRKLTPEERELYFG
jgi:WD40 repeat protein